MFAVTVNNDTELVNVYEEETVLNDNIDSELFNSPSTDEEIEITVKQMNCNKSVSGDLSPQHKVWHAGTTSLHA